MPLSCTAVILPLNNTEYLLLLLGPFGSQKLLLFPLYPQTGSIPRLSCVSSPRLLSSSYYRHYSSFSLIIYRYFSDIYADSLFSTLLTSRMRDIYHAFSTWIVA
jgi:hypothetical protein